MHGTGGASRRAPGFMEPRGEHSTEPEAPPQGLSRRAPGQAHHVTIIWFLSFFFFKIIIIIILFVVNFVIH